jgi:hypothetical protein
MGWYRAKLDKLRVYNKALSAAEDSILYQAEVCQVD